MHSKGNGHDRREGEPRAAGIDAPFSVDFVHRLRFTHDALDPANPTLADVLPAGPDGPHSVLAFVDGGVLGAWPDLPDRLGAYADRHGDRIALCRSPIPVPGGERAKNDRDVYDTVVAAIDRAGVCRQSFVLVIGGGAVLDAVGFAAATAHRGVRLVRMPSTTLAQGDGGLGVKNGINAFGKKNFLGTFAVPSAVVNDLQLLETLRDDDYRAGFSEVVKVALIKDAELFERVAASAERVAAREPRAAHPLIRRCAELHLLHIVTGGDPFELTESRPLDFGHWSAHKLEQMSGFAVSHGDAVAIGVAIDVAYSVRAGWMPADEGAAVLDCLVALGFGLYDAALENTAELRQGLEEFREHLGGRLTVTMLRGIGRPFDVHELEASIVEDAIAELRERQATAPLR